MEPYDTIEDHKEPYGTIKDHRKPYMTIYITIQDFIAKPDGRTDGGTD